MLPLKCKIKLPKSSDPGSFGFARTHDVHTGVDLYCKVGEPVYAMEGGIICSNGPFTGTKLNTTWWNDTDYILISGSYGKILYGEIEINKEILSKGYVNEGDIIGTVKQVLKKDKGRPMSMLHIELYNEKYAGKNGETWNLNKTRPYYLEDVSLVLNKEIKHQRAERALKITTTIVVIISILTIINSYLKWT